MSAGDAPETMKAHARRLHELAEAGRHEALAIMQSPEADAMTAVMAGHMLERCESISGWALYVLQTSKDEPK